VRIMHLLSAIKLGRSLSRERPSSFVALLAFPRQAHRAHREPSGPTATAQHPPTQAGLLGAALTALRLLDAF
jgi:hypothetical protein